MTGGTVSPSAGSDVLVSGALLHDVGGARADRGGRTFGYTTKAISPQPHLLGGGYLGE